MKKKIDSHLQHQIRNYLNYYVKESLENNKESEQNIINILSEPLKKHLMMEANKIALIDSSVFRNNFSETLITRCISLIKELRCTPG